MESMQNLGQRERQFTGLQQQLHDYAYKQLKREQKDKVDQAKINIVAGCERHNYFDLSTALPEERQALEAHVDYLVEQGYAKRNHYEPSLVRIFNGKQECPSCV